MAFDHRDTDKLYDTAIAPLLKRLKITAIRVDRSHRNEDIDDQILAGLRECHLVIADLTYARPSVYFEAGVAQGRPVPVIYTCRRDHFKHHPDDLHGNLRVHFDLQMKPIIKWEDRPSASFLRQLTNRIRHVIRPLVAELRRKTEESQRANAFLGLSLGEKKRLLEQTWIKVWRAIGFRDLGQKDWPSRKMSRRLHVLHAYVVSKLTKKDLQASEQWLQMILPRQLREKISIAEGVTVHVFFICLSSISRRMVEEALPNYRISDFRGELVANGGSVVDLERIKPFRYRGGFTLQGAPGSLRAEVLFHIVSGADSEPEFRQCLKNALERIH